MERQNHGQARRAAAGFGLEGGVYWTPPLARASIAASTEGGP